MQAALAHVEKASQYKSEYEGLKESTLNQEVRINDHSVLALN